MSDFIWFIVIGIILLSAGLVLAGFGLAIGKKQKIGLLHSYHYHKVTEENKPAFCRRAGTGILIIGAGLALSGICTALTGRLLSLVFIPAGLVIGLALLISAEIRYNR